MRWLKRFNLSVSCGKTEKKPFEGMGLQIKTQVFNSSNDQNRSIQSVTVVTKNIGCHLPTNGSVTADNKAGVCRLSSVQDVRRFRRGDIAFMNVDRAGIEYRGHALPFEHIHDRSYAKGTHVVGALDDDAFKRSVLDEIL